MTAKLTALALLTGLCFTDAEVQAEETPSSTVYVAKVDPGTFPEGVSAQNKLGVTVSPAAVRLITPGVDKFSIYNLIGPPHFGEGITRRWNYVLFLPPAPGSSAKLRCRMEIRFGRERKDGYNVTVSEVIWNDQTCADRVAAAH
jgi:outer membrane protein assembly factor BamE (lipoprotein component of BamABCDE complex)